MIALLDTNQQPLAPCHPAVGRKLLRAGKAAVFKRFPFTLILKETKNEIITPYLVIKIDPGSRKTGVAVLNQTTGQILFAIELEHQGIQIQASLASRSAARHSRRSRQTRYREPRFLNRTRPEGWLPPSLESRIANTLTWVKRLCLIYPIKEVVMEDVKFDLQLLENPDIEGVQYQQGTLAGYEVREFLLHKWEHKCCYCGAKNVPLQIEHIVPKSRHGSNRIWNLCLACAKCNHKKGTQTAAEFGFPDLHKQAKQPLRDAAAVNSTRKKLKAQVSQLGLPLSTGSGGLTKFNRTNRGLPKTHWLDAACVGTNTPDKLLLPTSVLLIKAKGHGSRQMCRTNKFGFPKVHLERKKAFQGWQTGDLVKVNITKGKLRAGEVGRLTIRQRPTFQVNGKDVHPKYLTRLQRRDGYAYQLLRAEKQMALAASGGHHPAQRLASFRSEDTP